MFLDSCVETMFTFMLLEQRYSANASEKVAGPPTSGGYIPETIVISCGMGEIYSIKTSKSAKRDDCIEKPTER